VLNTSDLFPSLSVLAIGCIIETCVRMVGVPDSYSERRWVQVATCILAVMSAGFVWLPSVYGTRTVVLGLNDAV